MRKKDKSSPLIREIFLTHIEYKNASSDYKKFLEQYVDLIILEQPKSHHENYYKYWESLKYYETKKRDKI